MAHWNWLDWVLATIVAFSAVRAFAKGFAKEIISLAAVVAGTIIAAANYQRVAPWFADLTRSREIALGIGFLSLFLGTLAAGSLVSALTAKIIQTAALQWFDRVLGGIFGLVRGLLVDCVLVLALVAFAIKAQAVQQSVLAPYFTAGSRVIAVLMPHQVNDDFWTGLEKFRQALAQADRKAIGDSPAGRTETSQ